MGRARAPYSLCTDQKCLKDIQGAAPCKLPPFPPHNRRFLEGIGSLSHHDAFWCTFLAGGSIHHHLLKPVPNGLICFSVWNRICHLSSYWVPPYCSSPCRVTFSYFLNQSTSCLHWNKIVWYFIKSRKEKTVESVLCSSCLNNFKNNRLFQLLYNVTLCTTCHE